MSDLQEYQEPPKPAMREEVIDQLKLNFAHGNIEVEEFESRLEKANSVQTKYALVALVSDLPVIRDESSGSQVSQSSIHMNLGNVQESANLAGILSGVTRKGVWRPARRTNILTFMGGVDLDYTDAEIPPGVTEINAFCALGGVDIKVPDGINVEVDGIPILGGIDNRTSGVTDPSLPTLRIKAFIIMGGLEIKESRKSKKRRK